MCGAANSLVAVSVEILNAFTLDEVGERGEGFLDSENQRGR